MIYTFAEACREHEIPMPHVISESGRALTAHHALLLIKVIDVESQGDRPVPELDRRRSSAAARDDGGLSRRVAQERVAPARARDLPRSHVRQGARAGAVQQRRVLAARARDRRADLLRDGERAGAVRRARAATSSRTSSPISTRRSSIGTSATSRSSSRCPTVGRSISSSRSCRFIGSTRSRCVAARFRT